MIRAIAFISLHSYPVLNIWNLDFYILKGDFLFSRSVY